MCSINIKQRLDAGFVRMSVFVSTVRIANEWFNSVKLHCSVFVLFCIVSFLCCFRPILYDCPLPLASACSFACVFEHLSSPDKLISMTILNLRALLHCRAGLPLHTLVQP